MTVGAALVAGGTFASLALFELNLELPEAAILLPIALALGGVALLWAFAAVEWRLPPTPLVPVVTLLAIYALIVTIGFPTLERTRPTQLIASRLQQRTAPDVPAGSTGSSSGGPASGITLSGRSRGYRHRRTCMRSWRRRAPSTSS